MIESLAISWPTAGAIVGSVVAITLGAIRIMGTGSESRAISGLKKEYTALNERVRGVETSMARMETGLSGVITTQISDLKEDLHRLDSKMDVMVKEVINALASLKNKE